MHDPQVLRFEGGLDGVDVGLVVDHRATVTLGCAHRASPRSAAGVVAASRAGRASAPAVSCGARVGVGYAAAAAFTLSAPVGAPTSAVTSRPSRRLSCSLRPSGGMVWRGGAG